MSDYVRIDVVGTPAPKGSPRVVTRARNGRSLPFPRVLKDSKKTEVWQTLVKLAAIQAMEGRERFVDLALAVSVTFKLRRPKGHYGVRGVRPSAPQWPRVKPDLDKLMRTTMDGLEGVVFDGDSRIVRFDNANKVYAAREESEGAVIVVTALECPKR